MSRDFRPLVFFSSIEPVRAPEQWKTIFLILVRLFLSYSNFSKPPLCQLKSQLVKIICESFSVSQTPGNQAYVCLKHRGVTYDTRESIPVSDKYMYYSDLLRDSVSKTNIDFDFTFQALMNYFSFFLFCNYQIGQIQIGQIQVLGLTFPDSTQLVTALFQTSLVII